MITKIQTENGKHWAIVFDPIFSYEDMRNIQEGLIDIMTVASSSELFDTSKHGFYHTLSLLNETIMTHEQACEYERFLKRQKDFFFFGAKKFKGSILKNIGGFY